MSDDGEGTEWVTCPECGKRITDLWDYNLDPDRWTHVWCCHCDASIEMRDDVSHDFSARKIGSGGR